MRSHANRYSFLKMYLQVINTFDTLLRGVEHACSTCAGALQKATYEHFGAETKCMGYYSTTANTKETR